MKNATEKSLPTSDSGTDIKVISPNATEAYRITEQLPDDVRAAVEAMQRTTRTRRVYSCEEPHVTYQQAF